MKQQASKTINASARSDDFCRSLGQEELGKYIVRYFKNRLSRAIFLPMIIDFHTHIFPDRIAERATEKIGGAANIDYMAPATFEALNAVMDKCGVDKSVVLNMVTKETQHESVLRYAKSIDSERLISFGSVMPDSVSALEYIWKTSDEELKGLKLHPALQRFDLGDEKYFPIFDLARACGLIVTLHMGFDPSYPEELDARPEHLVKIMNNFPGLKIVAAHLGGMKLARDVLDILAGKADVYLDTAYCAEPWLDKGLLLEIVRVHGADKILFGSDYPWHLPSQEIELIRSLAISEEEKNLILGENAVRLLNL